MGAYLIINIVILVAIFFIVAKALHSFVQSSRRSQDMAKQEDLIGRLEKIEERLRQLEERLEK